MFILIIKAHKDFTVKYFYSNSKRNRDTLFFFTTPIRILKKDMIWTRNVRENDYISHDLFLRCKWFFFEWHFSLLLIFFSYLYNVNIFHYTSAGQQEYSSRQAGITAGIVLACLIPILLIVVCVGYRALKSRKEQREQEEVQARYFTANFEK